MLAAGLMISMLAEGLMISMLAEGLMISMLAEGLMISMLAEGEWELNSLSEESWGDGLYVSRSRRGSSSMFMAAPHCRA